MNQLLGLMQAPAAPLPPEMGFPAPPPDPMGGMPGAGMPPVGPGMFPSTDPSALAMAVQEALAQLAAQDQGMLEMQQKQAAMAAQPIIDQMMAQAAMPMPPAEMPMGPDPMMAFGESPGLPPMPMDEMAA